MTDHGQDGRGMIATEILREVMWIENWMQILSKAAEATEEPSFSQQFRESWAKSSTEHQVLFWLMLTGLVGMIAALVIVHWFQQRKHRLKPIVDDPRLLFEDLLTQLELAEEDKQVLRQMTSQARLRHPAVCLLSPSLMEWSRKLWQAEKGANIEPHSLRRVEAISEQLYDSDTPTRAASTST